MKFVIACLLSMVSLASIAQAVFPPAPPAAPPSVQIVASRPEAFTVVIPNAYPHGIYAQPVSGQMTGYYRNYDLVVEVRPYDRPPIIMSKPSSFSDVSGMTISTSGMTVALPTSATATVSKPKSTTTAPVSSTVSTRPKSTTAR